MAVADAVAMVGLLPTAGDVDARSRIVGTAAVAAAAAAAAVAVFPVVDDI